MTLSLPADVEPFLTDEWAQLSGPGVYALDLRRPEDPAAAWDQHYDRRPPWWQSFVDSSHVIYVGASTNVLRRLEEHRDGRVRRASILRVCDVTDVRGVWWMDSAERAFEREHGIAMSIQNAKPESYVHCR